MKTRDIKYRQPIFSKSKFVNFHYWGTYLEQGGEMANVGWLSYNMGVTDPRESQQYTGLTDHNGVEIYEGDLVKCIDHPTNFESGIGEVYFEQGSFKVKGSMLLLAGYGTAWTEVIGNIFESPELC